MFSERVLNEKGISHASGHQDRSTSIFVKELFTLELLIPAPTFPLLLQTLCSTSRRRTSMP